MTHVLIVEDERLVSEMMCCYIKNNPDRYKLVQAIKNAADAELFCLKLQIDLILMDVCTIDNVSGIDIAAKIKAQHPHIKIIVVTSAPEYRFIEKARSAGVESFWYKDISEEELIDVMDRTMSGESVYPEASPPVQIGLASSDELTKKELETLYWLVKYGSISAIAEKMEISPDGVNNHIRHLKEKTGIKNTNQLALAAQGSRLVLPYY